MSELGYEQAFREWAAEHGVAWERLRYPRPEAGGETLAYRLSPPAPPRGVVLAVHGAGNDALFALVGSFKRLLRRGYEVFTFDLDGHGRFGTTRFDPRTIAGAVPAAAEQSGAAGRGLALHTIGISLGGALLLHALPALPGVASATLMVAPLHIELSARSIRGELGLPLLRTLWREREHYGLAGLVPSFGPVKRAIYPLRLAVAPGPGAFGYVEVLNRTLRDLRIEERARQVEAPTLLLYGVADRIVPAEQGERLAERIPAAELHALPGETHLSTPLAPAAVERLLGWVEEHAAPVRPSQSPVVGRRSSVSGPSAAEGEDQDEKVGVENRRATDDRQPATGAEGRGTGP